MRKRFWTAWGVLVCLLIGSYFRPAALDGHLTGTVWVQVAGVGGGVRILLVHGDATISRSAARLLDREINTWRNLLYTSRWGRVEHTTFGLDTPGAFAGLYRLDVPLLFLLLALLSVALTRAFWRRTGAPPRLIWAEFRSPPPDKRRALRVLHRSAMLTLVLLSIATAAVWIGSYRGAPETWEWKREHVALAVKPRRDNLAVMLNRLSAGTFQEQMDQLRKEQAEKGARPDWHVGLEVLPGELATRYFTADVPAGQAGPPRRHALAGVAIELESVAFPTVTVASPALAMRLPGVPIGFERSLTIKTWLLALLLLAWPVWRLFRGPIRRARRVSLRQCRRCGYDLTGLTQPRCPECGGDVDPALVSIECDMPTVLALEDEELTTKSPRHQEDGDGADSGSTSTPMP